MCCSGLYWVTFLSPGPRNSIFEFLTIGSTDFRESCCIEEASKNDHFEASKITKPGKLPGAVIGVDYTLEYGSDRLEIQSDALVDGSRVLLVDDLLATGGTAAASVELIQKAGGKLVGCGFVIELSGLQGRNRLPEGLPVESLVRYG